MKSKFKSGASRSPAPGRLSLLLLLLPQRSRLSSRPGGGCPHARGASGTRRPLTPAPRAPGAAETRTAAVRGDGAASLTGCRRATPPPRGWHLPGQRHGRRFPFETARLAPTSSSSSSRLPLPLLPAAGRTNPLGPGCKSNLVPPAPLPKPRTPVTAENGQSTFPTRPQLHAETGGGGGRRGTTRDGTVVWRIERQQQHGGDLSSFSVSVSPPTPRQFWKLCITSCHRKPTSRRCKQTNTLCLHPPQNNEHPTAYRQ